MPEPPPSDFDHERLASQLICALRGRRSQPALSRRLGCRSNVLYTWESGRRFPTAAVFFRLAQLSRIDLPTAIASFLGGLPERLEGRDFSRPETTAILLSHLREGTTQAELAERLGSNRVSVGRWLKGEAQPRLPDLLRLIEVTSLRLLDFVDLFVPPANLAETRAAWAVLEAQRRVAYSLPWSHAVMRVLELRAYREHPAPDSAFIATRLGIPTSEAERCLSALSASRLIERRRGRWIATQVLAVDTRRNPQAGRVLKQHWAEVGLARLPLLEPGGQDFFSYNLFTVSEQDWARLRELHVAYYNELRRIVGQSQPAERVALVNLQLMRLDASAS